MRVGWKMDSGVKSTASATPDGSMMWIRSRDAQGVGQYQTRICLNYTPELTMFEQPLRCLDNQLSQR